MLRMVIEGNTKSDMTKWLKDYYSDIERVSGAMSLTTSIYLFSTFVLSLSRFLLSPHSYSIFISLLF